MGWPDENTSPTRKRGVGIIPRLRVGLVLKPLVQLLAAIFIRPDTETTDRNGEDLIKFLEPILDPILSFSYIFLFFISKYFIAGVYWSE